MTSVSGYAAALASTLSAGRVALTFFFSLMERRGCDQDQQRVLLGEIGRTTYFEYKKLPDVRLSRDTMGRISYLMGIHKSLRIIFSNQPERAYEWVGRANNAAPFNGLTALQYMLAGKVVDIADVRRYLEDAHFKNLA